MTRNIRSQLRIISGSAKGTNLTLCPGIRPMPSRMKHALFNILGDRLHGAAVLDLFAGTGSLGLEAASRGARCVIMVEKNRESCAVMETNAEKTHLREKCSILPADAYRACDILPRDAGPFNIVFLDPPYAQSEDQACRQRLVELLTSLARVGAMDGAAAIVLHVRAAAVGPGDLPLELETVHLRRYGTGAVMICRLKKTLADVSDPVVESIPYNREE